MKDNKGQVLVMFILLLPIVLMLMGLIIDTGLLFIEKRNVDNNIKEVIEYRFESDTDDEQLYSIIDSLLVSNIKNIKNKEIHISTNYISITINKEIKGTFSVLFNKDIYEIKTTYTGYINGNKLVISKE
jgi:hypothetical protein